MELPFLSITQPLGTFYICAIRADLLLDKVDILRRGLTEEERKNVQRKLDSRRQADIAEYLRDPDATFPTSIITAAYDGAVQINEKARTLTIPDDGKFGEVIDGQHRLEGLRLAIAQYGKELPDLLGFELPVVVMMDLQPESKAYVFSIINSKQTKVSSSLIADLFGLRETPSPEKACHDMAEAFNAKEGNPFYRGIKMLGKKHFESEILSQGAFVKYLLEQMISRTPVEDARLEKERKPLKPDPSLPLRAFYIDRKDDFIGKILVNYFSAIARVFPLEWTDEPKKFLLRKAAGYLALLMVLRRAWPDIEKSKKVSVEEFTRLAQTMKERVAGVALTSDQFGSSEQGAKALADALFPPPPEK